MNLQQMFETMRPFLIGQASHQATARALYGAEAAGSVDAARLTAYSHNYVHNVAHAAAIVYPRLREIVDARCGVTTWQRMLAEYGREHPMTSIRWGTEALPTFIAEHASRLGLDPWISEVADLELWQSKVAIAPDAEARSSEHGVALAQPLELRDYEHDVLAFLDAKAWDAMPEKKRNVVALWRPADKVRRSKVGALALSVLRAVLHGTPVASIPRPREEVERVHGQLLERGLIVRTES